MNLHKLLGERAEAGNPVRVGLIGAGKFGAMFLAQARLTSGLHILGIADLDVERARSSCLTTGWSEEQVGANSLSAALASGKTHLGDDAEALIQADGIEVIIEATGNPEVGIAHCLRAIENGRHIIMVNVEADVVAGPLLARRAEQAGVIYSLAWGDQPALICEHVDWARAVGFEVVCAGKGTRYLPEYHQSTPDSVWDNYIFGADVAERGGLNAKMFNSFIDGTKSGIEMSAVCNATGLTPQPGGLNFPPCSADELSTVCRPVSAGGTISHSGTTEVVSSLHRDGTPVQNDLMMGTYVVIKADNDYVRHCFEEYRMLPDEELDHATLFRPVHMIGLELGVSVASVALRGEATGAPTGFRSDVVSTAKRDLKAGEILDGEGGYCVWGKQMPAADSIDLGGLPLGLANNLKLVRDIARGDSLRWDDVVFDPNSDAVKMRRDMELAFGRGNA